MTVLIILLILFALMLFIIVLQIQIEFKIIIKNGKNYSFIIIRLLKGLIRLRMNLSIISDSKRLFAITMRKTDSRLEKKTSIADAFNFMLRFARVHNKYKTQMEYMKSKIKVNNFSVRTKVGVGDAAATALISGGFFTIFTMIIHRLENRYSLRKQKLIILPFFQGTAFDLDLDCIINFKIGHIIITGVKMLKKKMKAVNSNNARASY